VEINGRPIPARVTPTPFFDPENARVRAEPHEDDRRSEAALQPEPSVDARTNVPASHSPDRNARR
jgi:aminomethyltransferase